MGSKKSSRRRFLQKGAAFAGLAATPASLAIAPRAAGSQTRGSAVPDMNSMEYVLYGERSRFVNAERILEGHDHHEVNRPRTTGSQQAEHREPTGCRGKGTSRHLAAPPGPWNGQVRPDRATDHQRDGTHDGALQ